MKTFTLNDTHSLFESPIKKKKVRNGIYAEKYRNGVINIAGNKYVMYSMTEAIAKFRKDYKEARENETLIDNRY